MKKKHGRINNQRGALTLDFIFAFVMVMGLSGILLALSISLTASSITQYITFASARAYDAGNLSPADQKQMAESKFQSLQNNSTLAPLFKGGWFSISPFFPNSSAEVIQQFPDYAQPPGTNNLFMGVLANFQAKMLNFKIPFFGSTTDSDNGFQAVIGSYLSREPTTTECMGFKAMRWNAIKHLDSSYSQANSQGATVIMDNGC